VTQAGYYVIYPEVGITSTPVIDRNRDPPLLNVVSAQSQANSVVHKLFAIDLRSGVVTKGPQVIGLDPSSGKYVSVPGNGMDSNNGLITFNPLHQINRTSLLLQNSTIYVAFAGLFENYPYHGWVFGYDAETLKPIGSPYLTSPNGAGAGIWQSGNWLAGDGAAIYAATGNGGNDTARGGASEYLDRFDPRGSSAVKLNADLSEADWFTPHNQHCLDSCDLDLSTGGPVFLPGSQQFIVGGKEGRIYLLDSGKLGQGPHSNEPVGRCFRATVNPAFPRQLCENDQPTGLSDGPCPYGSPYDKTNNFGQIHGSPVIWTQRPGSRYRIFVQGQYDRLKAFQYDSGALVDPALHLLTCSSVAGRHARRPKQRICTY
jgi:hypothetical protein